MERIPKSHRPLFRGIAQAAFANPFGHRRQALDAELAGVAASTPRDEVVDQLLVRVRGALSSVAELDVRRLAESDRRDAELTVLFDVFHRHAPDFDRLIEQQTGHREPVTAAFGPRVVGALEARGFERERAERLLGVLYQVRRAFYFISHSLAGRAACMQRLRERVWQNVFTDDIILYESTLWSRMEDFSTFFVGETGTGKGTAAAALGRAGWIGWDASRKRFESGFDDGFVAINLSQFPESLIESELFGHRKGAFTGAVEAHDGVFARCRPHGTIFLDEIGEVGEPVQIKLLRVLQERVFNPVGSHEELRFRGRIVAATNRSPVALRADGKMRDDFYYRLCSDVIEVPTLRRRIAEDPEELPLLVDSILHRIVGSPDPALRQRVVDVAAERLGADYPWPGNVRELEQCIRRVLVTQTYEGEPSARPAAYLGDLRITAAELLGRYCAELYEQLGSYEAVGRIVELDRRTVKRHVDASK